MRAVVMDEFGGPEVLTVRTVDPPTPGPGQVRVRVRAAGVNGWDLTVRSGAAERMVATTLPTVLGLEVAGTVDAVGDGVTGLSVGDDVLGFADGGGYAEQALASTVAAKPRLLGWAAAAALPVAAETALRVLGLLEVDPGDTLLVHGAAGSVGTLAVQLAVTRGATVIGTAGEHNQAHVRDLGATAVLYGDGLVERVRDAAPDGVDAVFDAAGRGALRDSIELRRGTSRIVTIADPEASALGVRFSSKAVRDAAQLSEVAQRAADGTLTVTVGRTFPLEEAAAAHRALESGHGTGKTVLLVQ
jgi:NADPH:quinone reductase-like Zn-dependent oxidoreductase